MVDVIGRGPVEFMDANNRQWSIPLTALEIASGTVKFKSGWSPTPPLSTDDSRVLAGWLEYLFDQGLLEPAPAPAKKPALLVKAANPGAQGNQIQVEVSNIVPDPGGDPTLTKFDLTVSETDTYTALTAATIASILGTDASPPGIGLVHVVGTVSSDLTPVATSSPTGVSSATPFKDSKGKTVVTLDARAGLPSGDPAVEVSVTNVDDTAKTFDLTATWTKTASGVTIGTAAAALAALSYLVTISPPASGAFSVPAPRTVTLSGGSASTPASATLFAS